MITRSLAIVLLALTPPVKAIEGAAAPVQTFSQRVAAAKGGEVINGPAAPADLVLVNSRFSKPITIKGGRFHFVKLSNSSGIRFVGSTFARTASEKEWRMVWLLGGGDYAFENVTFDGAGTTTNGLNLQNVQRVSVTNSRFVNLDNGARGTNTEDVTIRGNSFVNVKYDSVGFGSPRRLIVDDNSFSNPQAGPIKGFHPDGVQIWDIKGVPAHDIAITNNVMDVDAQGIWVPAGHEGYDRVTIRGNRVNTGRANAIALSGARDSVIEDNEITTRAGAAHMSKFWIERNERLTVRGVKVCKALDKANTFVTRQVTLGWRCPR